MEIWIAEVFDYSYEIPMLVGVYSTEEQARVAIDIVINRVREKGSSFPIDKRFDIFVTPVQLDGFAPAVMDWLGSE